MVARNNIQKLIVLLFAAVGMVACINDQPDNFTKEPGGSALVKLEVRVQANDTPTTRALQQAQEDEVNQISVLLFDKGTPANWDTRLRHIGRSVGPPQGTGTTKQFTVELYSGQWDIWVLANTGEFSDDLVEQALTKSQLQASITRTQTGKWNVDPTDPDGAYRIPLWGMLDAVAIETSTTAISASVNLYRMLVKVDVEVQRTPDTTNPAEYPGITEELFELTYVSLHNHNTTGRIVPGVTADDGDWTNPAGGAALRTSLPADPGTMTGWQPAKRLEWSTPADFSTPGTALRGVIYTFEADAGTHSGNRPCIIIGGRYNQSNEVTYYRADFASAADSYLSLLRNHRYTFLIRKIGGKGMPTVQEAYEAGPTNLEAEVIRWSDGGMLEGVWNGSFEIRFSTREVHFDQFGDPQGQVIHLRSNVPGITLDEFSNITAGWGDDVWYSAGDMAWSNFHFFVQLEQGDSDGQYTNYTITLHASNTHSNDPVRVVTFKVKGYMLEVPITMTQEQHVEFRLITTPDPTQVIFIDGAPQRIRIGVQSTSEYRVEFNPNSIFNGVYRSETDPVSSTVFEANTAEIFVGVNEHTVTYSVIDDFYIRHTDTNSSAPAKFYNVMQTSAIIVAELSDGGFSAFLSRNGAQRKIVVESNLAKWHPTLSINGTPCPEEDLPEYFDIINGVKTEIVTFTAPPLPADTPGDIVYLINFHDTNGDTETENDITLTQRAINSNPPKGGTPAVEWVLAVDENGLLNLNGDGYIVYFMWGSTIAIAGGANFSSEQIAWMPDEYDAGHIGNDIDRVPYASYEEYGTFIPPDLPGKGLGDPCRLATKDGVTGGFKMATPATYSNVGGWTTRTINNIKVNGRVVNNVFLPVAGTINGSGEISDTGFGIYRSSEVNAGNGAIRCLTFNSSTSLGTTISRGRQQAIPIRCIRDNN